MEESSAIPSAKFPLELDFGIGGRIRLVESIDGSDCPYGNGRVYEYVERVGKRVAEEVDSLENAAVDSWIGELVS